MISFLSTIALLLLTQYTIAQTDCPDTLTTTEFIDYVKRFPACRVTSSITVLRHQPAILDSAFDDDDNFVGQVDYDQVENFCRDVAECKGYLSSCQGKLYQVVENAGKALCQNGIAMTQEIKSAVSSLLNKGCDFNKIDEMSINADGCYLTGDNAVSQTYVKDLARSKKIESARDRCVLRSYKSHGVCTSDGATAYGTLLAASQLLEMIDTTYLPITSYEQEINGDRKRLKLFGLTHLSYNDKTTTCTNLPEANVLLWNTRVRIDGTSLSIMPTSKFSSLNQVSIQFTGADGAVVDSYSASVSDTELVYQTRREQAQQDTHVKAKKIGYNQVLLTYTDIHTTIAIGLYSNNLAVVAYMPTSLLEKETVGLLVDGCQLYSGTVLTDTEASITADCKSECNFMESYNGLCGVDCSNDLPYHNLYNTIELLTDAASDFTPPNGSTTLSSNVTVLFILSLLSVFHHLL